MYPGKIKLEFLKDSEDAVKECISLLKNKYDVDTKETKNGKMTFIFEGSEQDMSENNMRIVIVTDDLLFWYSMINTADYIVPLNKAKFSKQVLILDSDVDIERAERVFCIDDTNREEIETLRSLDDLKIEM